MSSSPINIPRSSLQNFSARERSASRTSSRASLRSHSPSLSLDDPVHVRSQISTLKHNIRHQQAQLQSLENIIRVTPRSYSHLTSTMADDEDTTPTFGTPSSISFKDTTPLSNKLKSVRRSSYEVLQSIAGPDSNLPLPRRVDDIPNEDVIREGIPMTFNNSVGSINGVSISGGGIGLLGGGFTPTRRPASPTRSLSRIPVSAVGYARALADDGHSTPTRPLTKSTSINDINIPSITSTSTSTPELSTSTSIAPSSPYKYTNSNSNLTSNTATSTTLTLNPPSPSPSKRISLTPGGTTKVLADLQAGVSNARHALENTKSQLRLSQRTVASLTRKVEDLKEVEERLRVENEGLNNVVARKERLLQEVLERARKAEAEAAALKAQLKQETTMSKKTIRDMETGLAESTALSKKSEREYITLRDSIKGMVESWKQDTESLKNEMKKREDRLKKEQESVGKKYKDLVQNVKEREKIWEEEWKTAKEEDRKKQVEVETFWVGEIKRLEDEVEKSGKDCEKATRMAKDLKDELAIMRRRVKAVRSGSKDKEENENVETISVLTSRTNGNGHLNSSSSTVQQENVPP